MCEGPRDGHDLYVTEDVAPTDPGEIDAGRLAAGRIRKWIAIGLTLVATFFLLALVALMFNAAITGALENCHSTSDPTRCEALDHIFSVWSGVVAVIIAGAAAGLLWHYRRRPGAALAGVSVCFGIGLVLFLGPAFVINFWLLSDRVGCCD